MKVTFLEVVVIVCAIMPDLIFLYTRKDIQISTSCRNLIYVVKPFYNDGLGIILKIPILDIHLEYIGFGH